MDEKELIKYYDLVVGENKDYQEMIKLIAELTKGDVLEIGSGTGLLTAELLKRSALSKILCIDISEEFVKNFQERFPILDIICADAINYSYENKFTMIVMSLVYHHIKDEEKENFLKNMFNHLADGGQMIIGDAFILPYVDEGERNNSLKLYHQKRITESRSKIAGDIERQSLKDGLERNGEWKTSVEILKKQLLKVGFEEIKVFDVCSQETGGYKVVTAIKP